MQQTRQEFAMPPMLKFLIRRILTIPVTLIIITMSLYAIVMLSPPEERARLYWPNRTGNRPIDEEKLTNRIIEEYNLNDPYYMQYGNWLGQLLQGNFGWSPQLPGDVLEALIVRTPVTAELTLYSVLFMIPLGLIGGVLAASKHQGPFDSTFRLAAFIGTSIPPFILGLLLVGVFYAGLNWFPTGRLSISTDLLLRNGDFQNFTGLLTIDGILNRRIDVTIEAFRHLVLPVVTLSLAHWATLGRVMRSAMLDESNKKYILAARARGLSKMKLDWRHSFRNALVPALTSTALSAASLITGVFIVEVIFNYHGLSELITFSFIGTPDSTIALGFAVYSVLLVVPLMLILDIIQAFVDPRIRERIGES
jgi:ABC-type dipeptide/oligopeptide/nickel transport system permease component